MSNTTVALSYPSRAHGSPVVGGVRAAHLFIVLCFICVRPVSSVPSVSELSILDWPFGFLYRLFS